MTIYSVGVKGRNYKNRMAAEVNPILGHHYLMEFHYYCFYAFAMQCMTPWQLLSGNEYLGYVAIIHYDSVPM
jgi:hypothetical protein